jgi:hypothetical protein
MPRAKCFHLALVSSVAIAVGGARVGAQTFTVTNANDSGAGSLRQAILSSNISLGPNFIHFAIPGSGVHTIALATSLPEITFPVTVDGYTQPGSSPNTNPPGHGFNAVLKIEIDGTAVGSQPCLTIGASSAPAMVVKGLVINRCSSQAILIDTPGTGAVVTGNFIGTDPTGSASAGPQEFGLMVQASGAVVSGNLISGNSQTDARFCVAPGAVITGNLIGTNAAGTAVIEGSNEGLEIACANVITVGGTTPEARNVISVGLSNSARGVAVYSSGTTVEGNYVGTDVTGTLPLGNAVGIYLNDQGATGSSVLSNVIGGDTIGVEDHAGLTVIQGNFIGTDATATREIGNSSAGIFARGGDTVIGGTGDGQSNVIAHNGSRGNGAAIGGVEVDGTYVAIQANHFLDNHPLGIDLLDGSENPGISPDDACDGDTGGNFLQNFPIITQVIPGASSTHVEGYLNSTASTAYVVDFYAGPACFPRPRDPLEGETYLGSADVSTDASCVGTFFTNVPVVLLPGQRVAAVATDPLGNTSEFSQAIVLSATPQSGPASGGASVTLGGMLFESGSTVTFGGAAASSTYVSPSEIVASSPALVPGSVNDITVTGSTLSGTLANAWVADFLDVPHAQQFHDFVVTVVANGVAAGIGGGNFGVANPTLRQQMAVFLLKGEHGVCYTPPTCTGSFMDVPCPSEFANWIEALSREGITGGCGGGKYCPQDPVLRDQMAVFLLKAEHGSSYVPPACAGVFADVSCPSLFADWVEQLYAEGVTGGCGTAPLIYCPLNPVTRGQMAVFLTKTIHLQ